MEQLENNDFENIDDALYGNSLLLLEDEIKPTYKRELFNKDKLDYSISSLEEIQKYIKK